MADCYTFALSDGTVLRYGDKDVPLSVAGNTFSATSLRISGLRFKCDIGLDVDSQEIDIVASATDKVGATPFLVALRVGRFDGATVTRDRAIFAPSPKGLAAAFAAPAVGSINLFSGQIGKIDAIGRISARLTVVSGLTRLDVGMPRNYWLPSCNHALYDAGCTLRKRDYAASGTVAAGSTVTTILWPAATATFAQGTLTMTSGLLAGVSAGIKAASPGVLALTLPFEAVPAVGDTFDAFPGCDHTRGPQGCAKFANLGNFRGFPYVPRASSSY